MGRRVSTAVVANFCFQICLLSAAKPWLLTFPEEESFPCFSWIDRRKEKPSGRIYIYPIINCWSYAFLLYCTIVKVKKAHFEIPRMIFINMISCSVESPGNYLSGFTSEGSTIPFLLDKLN